VTDSSPVTKVDLSLVLNPDPADLRRLTAGLNEHSVEFTATPGFEPIAFFAREPSGELTGGVYGHMNWTWLSVSLLWVSPTRRGERLGSRLLLRIESEASRRGCEFSHLNTFSFQAFEFYKAHGYESFAELPNYPDEHQKIFLKKRLDRAIDE
jgi:GNAT superfamily N-acetyltransferase